jgi:hypothetical protein
MTDDSQAVEIARLQTRVQELEAELAEQQRRTNAIVADSQERLYWLDRWHIDLNALMARPGAGVLRGVLGFLRPVLRLVRGGIRRLTG